MPHIVNQCLGTILLQTPYVLKEIIYKLYNFDTANILQMSWLLEN